MVRVRLLFQAAVKARGKKRKRGLASTIVALAVAAKHSGVVWRGGGGPLDTAIVVRHSRDAAAAAEAMP